METSIQFPVSLGNWLFCLSRIYQWQHKSNRIEQDGSSARYALLDGMPLFILHRKGWSRRVLVYDDKIEPDELVRWIKCKHKIGAKFTLVPTPFPVSQVYSACILFTACFFEGADVSFFKPPVHQDLDVLARRLIGKPTRLQPSEADSLCPRDDGRRVLWKSCSLVRGQLTSVVQYDNDVRPFTLMLIPKLKREGSQRNEVCTDDQSGNMTFKTEDVTMTLVKRNSEPITSEHFISSNSSETRTNESFDEFDYVKLMQIEKKNMQMKYDYSDSKQEQADEVHSSTSMAASFLFQSFPPVPSQQDRGNISDSCEDTLVAVDGDSGVEEQDTSSPSLDRSSLASTPRSAAPTTELAAAVVNKKAETMGYPMGGVGAMDNDEMEFNADMDMDMDDRFDEAPPGIQKNTSNECNYDNDTAMDVSNHSQPTGPAARLLSVTSSSVSALSGPTPPFGALAAVSPTRNNSHRLGPISPARISAHPHHTGNIAVVTSAKNSIHSSESNSATSLPTPRPPMQKPKTRQSKQDVDLPRNGSAGQSSRGSTPAHMILATPTPTRKLPEVKSAVNRRHSSSNSPVTMAAPLPPLQNQLIQPPTRDPTQRGPPTHGSPATSSRASTPTSTARASSEDNLSTARAYSPIVHAVIPKKKNQVQLGNQRTQKGKKTGAGSVDSMVGVVLAENGLSNVPAAVKKEICSVAKAMLQFVLKDLWDTVVRIRQQRSLTAETVAHYVEHSSLYQQASPLDFHSDGPNKNRGDCLSKRTLKLEMVQLTKNNPRFGPGVQPVLSRLFAALLSHFVEEAKSMLPNMTIAGVRHVRQQLLSAHTLFALKPFQP